MNATNRILIVDDHDLFRAALREFLSREPDFRVVGEAASVRDAIRSIGALTPNLVLTDLSMPDAHGIDAVTEIRRHYPDVKIVVLSSHIESEYRRQCRVAGATGYVVKDEIHQDLLVGMRTALDGKTRADPVPGYEAASRRLAGSSTVEQTTAKLVH
jgi:two-component system, NarL family, invasion response regulator UvrY